MPSVHSGEQAHPLRLSRRHHRTHTKIITCLIRAYGTSFNASGNNAYRPTVNAWNPDLLELTMACLQPDDDAEAWAAFVHQQRFSEDYRAGREGLALPLILHLARLADDYALSHEIEEALDPRRLSLWRHRTTLSGANWLSTSTSTTRMTKCDPHVHGSPWSRLPALSGGYGLWRR
ncbi:RNaseH domain-containing protein [Streptomyces sparsogenes]|uniref:RNaseH domain-containing protein n=1 Tax=Streptomyces sparsogenes TaxID=67365 RepID=UPI00332E6C8E